MPNLRAGVMVNKLSSDWQVARAVLEDEYKVFRRNSASTKIRTRHEFVTHLLDVHRVWTSCGVCPCSFGVVASSRDVDNAGASTGSAAQLCQQFRKNMPHKIDVTSASKYTSTTDGLEHALHTDHQAESNDGVDDAGNINEVVFPLARADNGEDGPQADVNTSTEKASRGRDLLGHSEKASQDLNILIKHEGSSQEHCDVDMESSRNEATSQQRFYDSFLTQGIASDLPHPFEKTNPPSYLHIRQKEVSQEHYVVDMDSSQNDVTDCHRPEGDIPAQDIGSDVLCYLEMANELIKQEIPSQEQYDVNMECSMSETTAHQKSGEDVPTQLIGHDGQETVNSNYESSSSIQIAQFDGCIAKGSSQDLSNADGQSIVNSNYESSSSIQIAQFDGCIAKGSCRDLSNAGIGSHKNTPNKLRFYEKKQLKCSNCTKKYAQINTDCSTCKEPYQRSECEQRLPPKKHQKSQNCMNTDTPTISDKNAQSKTVRTYNGKGVLANTSDYSAINDLPTRKHVCNKAYSLNHKATIHMRTHTGEKPLKCHYCSQRCTSKSGLLIHIRSHTGEKPFKCNYCTYRCAGKSNLNTHMRIHTGEKNLKCDYCNYRCYEKHTLTKHIRTHTGEKPFQCSICSRRFAQKSFVRIHMRSHTGEKPYHCSICNRRFSQKQQLNRHMKTH